jgi:A/G-specific adenine glycosylase
MASSIRGALYDQRSSVQRVLSKYLTAEGRRTLPWRRTADPFRLLVAEKLLQQTAARQGVVRAYRAILTRWPTARELAAADVIDVWEIVEPLGLPYRASELVAMAKAVARKHGGTVPLERRKLLALPGVGEYSANAVLSFTGHEHAAVVDTNVARFLRRLFDLDRPQPANPARNRQLQRLASWLIVGASSRDLNYAILDLTNSYCVANEPRCERCLLRSLCATGISRGVRHERGPRSFSQRSASAVPGDREEAAAGSRLN